MRDGDTETGRGKRRMGKQIGGWIGEWDDRGGWGSKEMGRQVQGMREREMGWRQEWGAGGQGRGMR